MIHLTLPVAQGIALKSCRHFRSPLVNRSGGSILLSSPLIRTACLTFTKNISLINFESAEEEKSAILIFSHVRIHIKFRKETSTESDFVIALFAAFLLSSQLVALLPWISTFRVCLLTRYTASISTSLETLLLRVSLLLQCLILTDRCRNSPNSLIYCKENRVMTSHTTIFVKSYSFRVFIVYVNKY